MSECRGCMLNDNQDPFKNSS